MTMPGAPTAASRPWWPCSLAGRARILLLACVAVSAPVAAQGIDIAQAVELAQRAPGSVDSARLNVEARGLQVEALRNIHRPDIALTGFTGRVRTSFNLDTAQLAGIANPLIGGFDLTTGLQLPPVPSLFSFDRTFQQTTVSLAGVWPLYTGGRLEALRNTAKGRAAEAQADLQEETDKSATTVAQRYFSVQLARHAQEVRDAALAGMRQHLDAARKLEAIGLIARAERLKADVAVAEAQRDASKAASDLELARVALSRLLDVAGTPRLATPLFAHVQPIGTLQSFVDAALQDNPAWTRIAAKRAQADAARRLVGGAHSPTVVGVGSYNHNRGSDGLVQPTWFLGLMVRVPLIGPVDRRALAQAAQLDEERVEVAARQAQRDIPTLVESQWRAMENARATVVAMDPQIALARENLRLQQVSFQQQQSTALDVIDARLQLAKVQVERSQAAYEYVLALARLLEATGQPGQLAAYARNADLKLASGLD